MKATEIALQLNEARMQVDMESCSSSRVRTISEQVYYYEFDR